jgi:hypothetical protein
MFQHTKGVIKALVVAVIAIFGLSFFMPSQIVLQKELVVNVPQEEVFSFLEDGGNIKSYFPNLEGVILEDKGYGDYIFIGHDDALYRLELRVADKAKGVELTYYKEDEKKGVFLFTTLKSENQTMLSQTQFWNLGYNPITKLLGHQTKDQSEDKLLDEMINLKETIEETIK